jgi:hypothetical protein
MDRLFTLPDAWVGGSYELAIEYRTSSARARGGIVALWSHPDVGGCYQRRDVEPDQQTTVEPSTIDLRDHAYGACVLNGSRVAATFVSIPYEHGPTWLYFGFPLGSLSRTYPVGAYPFDDGSDLEWRDHVDSWLRMIGEYVFARAPFDCALISHEPEEDVADEVAAGAVPKRRWEGILVPEDNRLSWYPPTENFPYTFDG